MVEPANRRWVYRYTLAARLSHWITVLALAILVPSGFQIFNAHPALYWGERSDRDRPLFALNARISASGEMRGVTEILGHPVDTTGILGASAEGAERALPFRRALAPEFGESARSAVFPPNGTTDPDTSAYRDLAARGFAD